MSDVDSPLFPRDNSSMESITNAFDAAFCDDATDDPVAQRVSMSVCHVPRLYKNG